MKKVTFFLIASWILLSSAPSPFAEFVVCIDPGHGGVGAHKYHNGGDGRGTAGPILGIAEQWVNFHVACSLKDSIEWLCMEYDVIMTRECEADTNYKGFWSRNQWRRANIANYAKGPDIEDDYADEFISIHHNGFEGNDSIQGTEVFWSSKDSTDSSYSRCSGLYPACEDSMLAWKIQLSLTQAWDYDDRCHKPMSCGWYCCDAKTRYAVLRRTVMVSALSEASFLRYPAEELLFNDPSGVHIGEEASAIFGGWDSYMSRGGVNHITYVYQGGGSGRMIVDGDTVLSPHYVVWDPGEVHTIQCQDTLVWGAWQYEFSHWSQDLLGGGVNPDLCWINPHLDTIWTFTVPQGENRYYAYMKGGPYRDSVYSPNGGEVWAVGEVHPIRWFAFEGADSTTLIDLFLSTDGGSNWEIIETGLPWGQYQSGDLWTGQWYWTVSATPSTECRIKVRAYDCAGNDTSDISNANFTINCAPKPSAPSNLIASNGGCDARITLLWQDNSNNEEGFNIYRDGVLLGSVGANVTTFIQTYLVTGRTYSYHVKAHIGDCESEISNTVNQTPSLMTPEAPTNLQVVNVGECQFLATWEDNSADEEGFAVYNGSICHGTAGPDVTSFQGYWYPEGEWTQPGDFYVHAYNGGCKSYSNHVMLDPPGGVIAAPSSLQLLGSGCNWTATWQNNDSYDRCQVKRLYTGCDVEPWDCLPDWYWYTYFSSCGQTSISPPSGCGCFCVSVRGGKWVDCGGLGDMKWSAYSNRPCRERVICNDPNPGCPYLFVHDGERFMAENTILAPVEMAKDPRMDVQDYYLLRQSIPAHDDLHKLRIAEFEQEHSFFDLIELLAVDHDFGLKTAVTGNGEIYVYNPANLFEPLSCYDEKGEDYDSLLPMDSQARAHVDGPGSLILDFTSLPLDSGVQLLLLPCCGNDAGNSKLNAKLEAGGESVPQIGLLVEAEREGNWHEMDSIPPRMSPQEVFVDVTGFKDANGGLRVRLSWDERGYSFSRFRCFKAEKSDQPKVLALVNASHSVSGDVTRALAYDDDCYIELLPGESLDLSFSHLPVEFGKVREYVSHCNGYYMTENPTTESVSIASSEELRPNHPNPFNPQTQIQFTVAEPSEVSLVIYNLLGQRVIDLVNETLPSGEHTVNWNGEDETGHKVASGIYFCHLQAGEYKEVRKMILMK